MECYAFHSKGLQAASYKEIALDTFNRKRKEYVKWNPTLYALVYPEHHLGVSAKGIMPKFQHKYQLELRASYPQKSGYKT